MHIIIDGYNMIRQSPHLRRFERSSLEEGRKALIRFVIPYKKLTVHRITVVFDGWKNGSFAEERDTEGGIQILYSRRGEKADELIKRIAETSGEEIMVVTSDRDIASFVQRRGGTAVSSPDFEEILATKFREYDPIKKMPEEIIKKDEGEESASTHKKGPARRLSRRERDYRKRILKL